MPCAWCYRSYALYHYDNIPTHLKYNVFIENDYRVGISWKECITSIFHWHNETLNIWTHLTGVIIFTLFIPLSLSTWLIGQDSAGILFCVVYILSSLFMLGASTMFHTFCCVSLSVYNFMAKIDYLGIAVQIVGSYCFICYYLFRCQTIALSIYLSLVGLSAFAVIFTTLKTNIHGIGNEKHRLALFIGFGFSLAVCAPHAVITHGWVMLDLGWRLSIMAILYIGGAFIYAYQIPERWFPGKVGGFCSHAIWHCFVLSAALQHYFTALWMVHESSFVCF